MRRSIEVNRVSHSGQTDHGIVSTTTLSAPLSSGMNPPLCDGLQKRFAVIEKTSNGLLWIGQHASKYLVSLLETCYEAHHHAVANRWYSRECCAISHAPEIAPITPTAPVNPTSTTHTHHSTDTQRLGFLTYSHSKGGSKKVVGVTARAPMRAIRSVKKGTSIATAEMMIT